MSSYRIEAGNLPTLTDYSFDPTGSSIVPYCAHILPFSLHGKVKIHLVL